MSARTTSPVTTPPAVLDCTVSIGAQPELARQRGRDGGAGGAGVDQEVDRAALDGAGPVVVAVGPAADLDHLAAGLEARLLRRGAATTARRGTAPRPTSSQTVTTLKVRGSSVLMPLTMPRKPRPSAMKALFHLAYHVTRSRRRARASTAACSAAAKAAAPTPGSTSTSSATRSRCTWASRSRPRDTGRVGDKLVPMPHLGLVLQRADWQALAKRLTRRRHRLRARAAAALRRPARRAVDDVLPRPLGQPDRGQGLRVAADDLRRLRRSGLQRRHALLDRAEHAAAVRALHLDADACRRSA